MCNDLVSQTSPTVNLEAQVIKHATLKLNDTPVRPFVFHLNYVSAMAENQPPVYRSYDLLLFLSRDFSVARRILTILKFRVSA
jgi:hypothetical protein